MAAPALDATSAAMDSQMRTLTAAEDRFGGVVIDSVSLPDDASVFVDCLKYSLLQWRAQGKRGVWLELPLALNHLVHPAIQEGFSYHHAESTYVMLVAWIADVPSTIPANASHHVGVRAFFLNYKHEVIHRIADDHSCVPEHRVQAFRVDCHRIASDVHPGLARTCLAILQDFLKTKLSVNDAWSSDVWDTIFRDLRYVEDEVRYMRFGGRGVLNRVRHTLRSAIKFVLSMVLIGSTPAVGAIAPKAAELGPLRAGNSDYVSTLAFGLVACIGVLFTILGFLMSIKWCKRQSRYSAPSTPYGKILTRPARTQQRHTTRRGRKNNKETDPTVVVVVNR